MPKWTRRVSVVIALHGVAKRLKQALFKLGCNLENVEAMSTLEFISLRAVYQLEAPGPESRSGRKSETICHFNCSSLPEGKCRIGLCPSCEQAIC